jgi:hypothetical protein
MANTQQILKKRKTSPALPDQDKKSKIGVQKVKACLTNINYKYFL